MEDKEHRRLTPAIKAGTIKARRARLSKLDSALNSLIAAHQDPGKFSVQKLSAMVLKAAKYFTGSGYGLAAYIDSRTGWMMFPTLEKSPRKRRSYPPAPYIFNKFSGLLGWSLTHDKALFTNSAATVQRTGAAPHGRPRIDKFLSAPAIFNGRLSGLIALADPKLEYNHEDLSTIKKLAGTYAMILQRGLSDLRLKRSERWDSSIIASSRDVIYAADMNGRITFISEKVKDYGYTPKDIIGRHITEFVHPDDRHSVSMSLAKIARTGADGGQFSLRLKKKNGSYIKVEENGGVIKKEGRPVMFSGSIRDVSERDTMRERLKKSEETLRKIFETATDAIFVKDRKGRYLQVNKAYSQILRLPAERILGRTDFQIFPKKTAASIRTTDLQVINTGSTIFTSENMFVPGNSRIMYSSKTPLKDANGETVGVLCTAKDITELKKLEAELIRVKALEAVSKVADPAAHDLNNILAAINGYAVLIMEALKADNPIRMEITQILKAVTRASAITKRLQAYTSGMKNQV